MIFDELRNRISALGNDVIDIIKKVFISKGKSATGGTISSLRQETIFELNSIAELNIYGSKVFDFIEEGRAPNSKMPPEGVLISWMQNAGIPLDKEFAIRRSIGIKGIAPVPIIELSFIQIQKLVKEDISEDIINSLMKTITEAVKNGIKLKN